MRNKYKIFLLFVCDLVLINLSVLCALLFRLDFSVDSAYMAAFCRGIPILSVLYLVFAYIFRVHAVMWDFAGVRDVAKLCSSALCASVFYAAIAFAAKNYLLLPRSVYPVACVFMMAAVTVVRLFDRVLTQRTKKTPSTETLGENILIIGGGSAANMLIHDIRTSSDGSSKTVYVIDDYSDKLGKYIYGSRIVGNRSTIMVCAKKYNIKTIIFAIPSCPQAERSEILMICSHTGCDVKTLPGIHQMLESQPIDRRAVRDVQIEDLLGRDAIDIHSGEVMGYVSGKVVMVTGGGGSIGSELCRQIAAYSPSRLIIFDIYENNAYDIQNELKTKYPTLNLTVLIGSVRDTSRLDCIFSKYRPQVIYHAAAHKHVPLMEDSPNESIKNNVFGTYNMAKTADRYGVERFVLISTDKAVNPTNIMGATKRICEMIVQTINKTSKTSFAAVRFGNVLGSNGSVIPLFKRQIARGGPVTVTHPDIIRYFMTIPEAVSLVLRAGAFAGGGEVFVLNMGEPVKIVTLAENLIRLSGYTPYKDIEIKFTGLRPGEKLYEELLMGEEGLRATENKLIFIGKQADIDETELSHGLDRLRNSMYDDSADIRAIVHDIVPTYDPHCENGQNHACEECADKSHEPEAKPNLASAMI